MRSYCTHSHERTMSANVAIRGRIMSAFINLLTMRLHCDPSAPSSAHIVPILRPNALKCTRSALIWSAIWLHYGCTMSALALTLSPKPLICAQTALMAQNGRKNGANGRKNGTSGAQLAHYWRAPTALTPLLRSLAQLGRKMGSLLAHSGRCAAHLGLIWVAHAKGSFCRRGRGSVLFVPCETQFLAVKWERMTSKS